YPSVPAARVQVCPADCAATCVFRQKRILPCAAGTLIERLVLSVPGPFTRNNWPVRAFSGRPPSSGGLLEGSRHVPVQVGGSSGSTAAVAAGLEFGPSVSL